jgi:UDP-N-acetylmuramoylalanine--D-glutamate ligase
MASAIDTDMSMREFSAEPSVLVMGMGITGASCARYFAARGIGAEFADTRAAPPGTDAILDAMPDARLHTGGQPAVLRPGIRKIVISPGVTMDSPLIAAGRERGVSIVSDIDLFVAECQAPIAAVTGSNGKSTVTSMLGVTLPTSGLSAAMGGNLGTPALDLLSQDKDVYVLELSSFQLERSGPVNAEVAVILNLSPDHLDLHGSMQAYAAAKGRIYLGCRHAVVNRDVRELREWVPEAIPITTFGLGKPKAGEIGIRETARGECIALGDTLLLSVDELPLLGRHNLSNALAALAVGATLGADLHSMAQALKRYRGLPHRMQVVGDTDRVVWVDDSKATNVAAAVMSIASIADPFVLIAGGDAKGASFEMLATALAGRQCSVILLGKDGPEMARVLEPMCEVTLVTDMQEAVATANAIVKPGYTVLLAPGCSSHDMFASFAERGEVFAAAIRELTR